MTWRSRPAAAIAALGGLLAASALAMSAPAGAAPASGPMRPARHTPGAAAPRSWLVSDPAAYTRAVHSGNWVYTPEGLAEKNCVHHVPMGDRVAANGDIVTRSGAVHRIARCAHPTLAYPSSGPARPVGGRSAASPAVAQSCEAGNKNWWAETCTLNPNGLALLTEKYTIPNDPQQAGALIFFFPSFEDSTGNSIVQPVLTWGANAGFTGVTNPKIWYITAWYGDDGTYFTGPSAHVNEGGVVSGEIQRGLCGTPTSECPWNITISVGSATVSKLWTSGPEMTQVDGGVMEVPRGSGCVEMPQGGHEAFRDLLVNQAVGNGAYTPVFQAYTVNPQCSVHASASGTSTDITWKTS
jgi:hypothetical protein